MGASHHAEVQQSLAASCRRDTGRRPRGGGGLPSVAASCRSGRWSGPSAQCNRPWRAEGRAARLTSPQMAAQCSHRAHRPLPEAPGSTTTPRGCREDDADAALTALRGELEWEQREIVLFGRRILQPRLIAWAGEVGYRYSGQTLEPRAFTPAARRLLERVRAEAGAPFNHVLVNRYRTGEDSMGLHADDEPELGRGSSGGHGVARRGPPLRRQAAAEGRWTAPGPRARPRGAPRDGGHLPAPLRPRRPAPGERHGRADQPDLSAAAPRARMPTPIRRDLTPRL